MVRLRVNFPRQRLLTDFFKRLDQKMVPRMTQCDYRYNFPGGPASAPRIIQRSRLVFVHVTVHLRPDCKHNEVRTYTLPGNCSRRRNENQERCASN